jgi:peptidoglycan hydrolase-like protein with peptidoglycan-binding domain
MQKKNRWAISAWAASGLLLGGVAALAVVSPSVPPGHITVAHNAASVSGISLGNCPTLSLGSHGGCVSRLQSELRAAGNPTLPVDGVFGRETRQAVMNFQEERNIVPAEGVAGRLTKSALDAGPQAPGGTAAGTPAATVPGTPAGAPPASAPSDSAAPAGGTSVPVFGPRSCGSWWPGGGRLTADFVPSSGPSHTFTEFSATVTFTFTQAEIDALRCTGSSALEMDVLAYGGLRRSGGGLRSGNWNVPEGYIDTEFGDSYPRVLTIGSDSAASLRANVPYHTQIRLTEFEPTASYAELYLNFQRGHWARLSSPKEEASCLGHGSGDPAWCVFGDESHPMAAAIGVPPRVSLLSSYRDTSTVSWGSYRSSQLNPGTQLSPGDRLYSPNGLNFLFMQSDGNLAEYVPGSRVAWASRTAVPGSAFLAQSDGNFVVVAPGNHPLWATGTSPRPGTVLQIQDDRNVVAYAPGHVAVWANNTAGQP